MVNDHPHEAIVETAKSEGCDLIIMGSHGRHGMTGFLLGSETQRVLNKTRLPVLVFR
jgi:nucleotide-binding universal stress UspA family protein